MTCSATGTGMPYTLHHQAKEALHIHIKDPSLNRNIGKVRIPTVFYKLLKLPRQLEPPT